MTQTKLTWLKYDNSGYIYFGHHQDILIKHAKYANTVHVWDVLTRPASPGSQWDEIPLAFYRRLRDAKVFCANYLREVG